MRRPELLRGTTAKEFAAGSAKEVYAERAQLCPINLGKADFQKYLLLPARQRNANRVNNFFGKRHGHFGNLVSHRDRCGYSGQNDPVFLGFHLNLLVGKAASDRFPQQRNVHIPKDLENARLVVFLPEHHAAAAGCDCGHHQFIGGCGSGGNNCGVADKHALQAGVSSDNNRVAHQNVQDLIAGKIVGRGCLLRRGGTLLLRRGGLLGAGRSSTLGHRVRANAGSRNNDSAERGQ